MAEAGLRQTPLWAVHRALGARLVPFAGWDMPVQYSGILDEARAVRAASGLFDISHMGRLEVTGDRALDLLQRTTSNDVASLAPGQAQYSLITNPTGGIVDDIIVYRRAESAFLVVVNASNAAKDLAWFGDRAGAGVEIDDLTAATAMVAVQGPRSPALVARMVDATVLDLPRFAFATSRALGAPATICRTGYTGEDGFEVITPAEVAAELWSALQDAGAAACGLGARDALRIEAGYPLYGHEIDETTTPVEAGLMWAVRLDKGPFEGRAAILATKDRRPDRRLVGIRLSESIVPRQGYTLFSGDGAVGAVTSGVFSPTAGRSVGMAYVAAPYHSPGAELEMEVRGRRHRVTVVPKKSLLTGR